MTIASKAYFSELFETYGKQLTAAGLSPNNGLAAILNGLEDLPQDVREGVKSLIQKRALEDGFIMRGGADAETAQEVAQEALIMVWRKAASFDRSAGLGRHLDLHHRPQQADRPAAPAGQPAGHRDRGLAGGICPRRATMPTNPFSPDRRIPG